MKEKQIWAAQNSLYHMCCFGKGGDGICITSNCTKFFSSWTSPNPMPSEYTFDIPGKGYLNGGAHRSKFRVEEIEVYQCSL